ncbi:MAG TPA: benzoate-CoA ligase family protein [Acidimicrobiales bacterium]|nr:benzoate-CoA ligase family protein [Acidimicrobiales bacterium]
MIDDEPFNAAGWLVDRHVDAGAGGRVAYRCGDDEITYADLLALTGRAATMLGDLGVAPGDRFIMVVSDEPAFPAVFLGGLRIGAVPIPVSTMLKPAEVAVMAADSGAVAAVLSEPFTGHAAALAEAAPTLRSVVVVDTGLQAAGPPAQLPPSVSLHSWSEHGPAAPVPPAGTTAATDGFWLYTSGTTGTPKAAVHRHGDIRAVAETYGAHVLEISPDDVCYSVAKLFFAFGLGNALLFPLAVGASAVIDPRPPTPARAAELALRHRPTLFFAPPGFCAGLADADVPADALASVRATVTAGETLPAEVYRRFRARFGVEMLDGIGSTEALHIFCSNRPDALRPGSTGRPVSGYDLRLTDDTGATIAEAEATGSLWVRGPSVTHGYWRRPEVNAATFIDGWCRTGDVYRRDADGFYWFVGRTSDMIKAGGIWVSPAEVEAVLLGHPAVLEAAVVGGRTDEGLEQVIAFVVPAAGRRIDEAELLGHCRERMAAFKRPRTIHVVDALPKTATGKIQRYALRAQLEQPVAAE